MYSELRTPNSELFENISLKKHNTFGIDVIAKYFIEIHSVEEIQQVLKSNILKTNKYLVISGGSNILFTKDFDGLILKIDLKGITITKEDDNFVYINANAGENWDDFIVHCINHNYYGLENLSGIPGNVGSSPVQNIGAYGAELKDVFYQLEAISVDTGMSKIFSNQDCEFGYRNSIFKNKLKNKYIILSVLFRLSKLPRFNIEYAELKTALRTQNSELRTHNYELRTLREIILKIRNSKLPCPSEFGNAGSFFKNPLIKEELLNDIKTKFPNLKYYPLPSPTPKSSEFRVLRTTNPELQTYKIPAAWLIEQCGWKGKKVGNVGVHSIQPLIIVNYGNASGGEVLELASKIQASVQEKFGIPLEYEVNIIS